MLMPCSAKVMRQGATLKSCSEIPIPVVVAPTVKGAFCTYAGVPIVISLAALGDTAAMVCAQHRK